MSSRLLAIRDSITLPKLVLQENAQQFYADAMASGTGSILVVATNASYSGYFIQGSRVYPGTYMQQGIGTWCSKDHGGVSPFNAPLLKNHNSDGDPLGRVIKAEYHKIRTGMHWFEDWKSPSQGYEKGSGYSRLSIAVSDKKAQEKFLDGRYSTFSTNFSTPVALCSVCGTDLLDERCEHKWGDVYDLEDEGPRLACIVTGPQMNKEVSIVNEPAQPWATTDEMKWVDEVLPVAMDSSTPQEQLDKQYFLAANVDLKEQPMIAIMDKAGNATLLSMDAEKIESRGKGKVSLPVQVSVPEMPNNTPSVSAKDNAGPLPKLEDEEFALGHVAKTLINAGLMASDDEMKDISVIQHASVAYIQGLTKAVDGHLHSLYLELDLVNMRIRGSTEGTFPAKKSWRGENHYHSIDIEVGDLNANEFTGETRDPSVGEMHSHPVELVIARDSMSIPSHEECLDLAAKFELVAADSDSLAADRRYMLKSSSFCGPGRSFPVPDCAHAVAARRLLNRAKLSSDQKAKVRDSITLKVEAMSCEMGDAEHIEEFLNMGTKTPTPPAGTETKDELTEDQKTVQTLRTQVEGADTRNSDLQSQLDTSKADNAELQTKLTAALADSHKAHCDNLALLRSINGRKADGHDLSTHEGLKTYVDSVLKERSADSIKDAVADELPAVVAKLPSLKGLPGFVKDGTPAGGDGAVTRTVKDKADPKPEPKTNARDVV